MGAYMDNLQNIDSNGNINTSYYENAIRDCINLYINELGFDRSKINSNNLYAIMGYVCKSIFKQMDGRNKQANIPYNENNIKSLLDIYINIAYDFGCLPSLRCFSRMVGIEEDTIVSYVTAARSLIRKERQEYTMNRLNESNLGVLTLANHEQSIGLMYNRQNIIDHASVKQSLNINDLIQLQEPSKQAGLTDNIGQ
jgi:hypothetical protein